MPKNAIDRIPGSRIEIPEVKEKPERFTMSYTIDENLLAEIKKFHIMPSGIIRRELRREVRRRKKALKQRQRRLIINRYSGEVLGLRPPPK